LGLVVKRQRRDRRHAGPRRRPGAGDDVVTEIPPVIRPLVLVQAEVAHHAIEYPRHVSLLSPADAWLSEVQQGQARLGIDRPPDGLKSRRSKFDMGSPCASLNWGCQTR